MTPDALAQLLDNIDLYWLDQLLKGRVRPGHRVLDAGCGMGRNLVYPLRAGIEMWGVDLAADDIAYLQQRATREWQLPASRFSVGAIEALSHPDHHFDAVCCCAVLHFARDDAHFAAMMTQLWRVLRPGGLFFARLAVATLLPAGWQPLGGRRYAFPARQGGTAVWYVPGESDLAFWSRRLEAEAAEPLRAVRVADERTMAVWVLRKSGHLV